MRVCDIVIGEYLEFKDPSRRFGYLKAVGIVLANQDHSVDWKFTGQKKVPYITIICEHTAFSKTDRTFFLRRFRTRDLIKEES